VIRTLNIDRFRGFEHYEVHGLGRINLLVGTNNCGKTTILEAIQLLASKGDPSTLWQIASRRGERLENTDARPTTLPEVDICHLFHGHEMDVGNQFKIEARTDITSESLTASVIDSSRQQQRQLFNGGSDSESGTGDIADEPDWAVELDWSATPEKAAWLALSIRGGISSDAVRRQPRGRSNGPIPVRFISTAGLTADDVVEMFEEIVLTREEELVTEALQAIDPTIERLATISGDRRRGSPGERGGILVRCQGSDRRIPIGSMGDGMWRILGLALALASAENGILLVDEIDTGLHFSVLETMWRMVDMASKRLGVQVFATTHSRDAYESLAAISRSSVSEGSEVTIQRIVRAKRQSVAFNEQEIIASAERGTEVR